MKTTLDILTEARGYVAQGWTQGATARMSDGTPISPRKDAAVCWCIVGAALRAGDPVEAWSALAAHLNGCLVTVWNDAPGRTQEEVLTLFDKAIDAERERT